jgi:hypothetical protein
MKDTMYMMLRQQKMSRNPQDKIYTKLHLLQMNIDPLDTMYMSMHQQHLSSYQQDIWCTRMLFLYLD